MARPRSRAHAAMPVVRQRVGEPARLIKALATPSFPECLFGALIILEGLEKQKSSFLLTRAYRSREALILTFSE